MGSGRRGAGWWVGSLRFGVVLSLGWVVFAGSGAEAEGGSRVEVSAESELGALRGEERAAQVATASEEVFFQPALKAGEVSLLTGDAAYALALAVPSGGGGLSVPLTLTYSSSVVNRQTGDRQQDGGWLGIGWTLDVGTIQGTGEEMGLTLGGVSAALKKGSQSDWPEGEVEGAGGWSTLNAEGEETARVEQYVTEQVNFFRLRRYVRDWEDSFGCFCDPYDGDSGCFCEIRRRRRVA